MNIKTELCRMRDWYDSRAERSSEDAFEEGMRDAYGEFACDLDHLIQRKWPDRRRPKWVPRWAWGVRRTGIIRRPEVLASTPVASSELENLRFWGLFIGKSFIGFTTKS